jgi:hypothetical protein
MGRVAREPRSAARAIASRVPFEAPLGNDAPPTVRRVERSTRDEQSTRASDRRAGARSSLARRGDGSRNALTAGGDQ